MIVLEKLNDYSDRTVEAIKMVREGEMKWQKDPDRKPKDLSSDDFHFEQQPDYLRVALLELRQIGWEIYAAHGLEGMQAVAESDVIYENTNYTSCVSSKWDGIGAGHSIWMA